MKDSLVSANLVLRESLLRQLSASSYLVVSSIGVLVGSFDSLRGALFAQFRLLPAEILKTWNVN